MTTNLNIKTIEEPQSLSNDNGFAVFNLHEKTLQAITESGYTTPTAIQAQAIPLVLAGNDLVGCAQTGTGKTASYTLPLIEKLLTGRRRARMPRALILAPTREIALQVEDNFKKYSKHHRLYTVLLMGGMSPVMQERAIMQGVDVLIATPGRLLDHMNRGKIILTDVQMLVIDEADRMLDMGFIPDVERIVKSLPAGRQTLMFSATMAKPIRGLAAQFLNNPKEVTIEPKMMTADTIEQFYCPVPEGHAEKRDAFRKLIEVQCLNKAIIFANRKRDVTIIAKDLSKNGFRAGELHGDMTQGQRLKTLARFKDDKIDFLVASDVAARGIHIDALPTVINYDVPTKPDDYVHRIGRTGRAGDTGKAFTLVTNEQKKHYDDVLSHIKSTMALLDLGYNIVFDERSSRKPQGRGGRFGGGGNRPTGSGGARPQSSGAPRRFNGDAPRPRPFGEKRDGAPRDGAPREGGQRSDTPRFERAPRDGGGDKPAFQPRREGAAPRREDGNAPRTPRPSRDGGAPRGDRAPRAEGAPRGERRPFNNRSN